MFCFLIVNFCGSVVSPKLFLYSNFPASGLVCQSWYVVLMSRSLVYGICVFVHPSTVAGQEDCWLLTETLIQTASLQLKVCLNVQCLALHSFTDLHPGKQHHSYIVQVLPHQASSTKAEQIFLTLGSLSSIRFVTAKNTLIAPRWIPLLLFRHSLQKCWY